MGRVKLGDIARECRLTYTGNKSGIPIIGLEHLTPGDIVLHSWDIDTDNTFNKYFKKGQVLLGRRRVYLKKAAVAPFDGICSGDITVIEAIPERLQPELLPFIIQNDRFFEFAIVGSAGSLSPRVKWEYLKDYEIELPDLHKQSELVELLKSANELKHAYQEMLTATDEMVKSQFIEMFGDIKTTSFPVYKLGEICDIHRGGSPRPISEYITNDPDGLNWIKIGDADEGMYISHTAEKIKPSGLNKTRKVYAGDLLLSNSMSFGRPYILRIDGCIHDGWLVLHFNHKNIEAEYLCSYLSQDSTYRELSKLAAGGVVNNLNSEVVKILPTILPPIEEQREYLAVLHQADKSKFELKQAIEKIDKAMQALMQ